MQAESRFRAMGTDCHIVLIGAREGSLDAARAHTEQLEHLWSRFIDDSEISKLNRSEGSPITVTRETFDLVCLAVEAWSATNGLFDPTVLRALEAAGYDRSFELLPDDGVARTGESVAGCEGFVLDEGALTIEIPPGVGFDPGGIGKGYAADLVVERLLKDRRARGVCVNLGGDLRVAGESPKGSPWTVAVEDPFGGSDRAKIALIDGAIATSSRARRVWRRGARDLHHIIDPRTGEPAQSDVLSATIVTGDAWWAEVLAKAAFLAGMDEATRLLKELDAPAFLIDVSGEGRALGGAEAWLS